MKLGEAKLLYESGAIFDPRIFVPSSGHGWCLDFQSKKKVTFKLYLEAERGGCRVFKTANAAVNACITIGCEQAVVDLSGK
jgi:hypothetical protein